ncbi:putative AAA-ATPase [Iris pallida]|uniref:AAA-ATPase n=1 Tax=Iris pallida TaxID=29817 RepID=A0AAX6F0G8_IRIPA|nr:putative AAA-ATPase [Iris pallida]
MATTLSVAIGTVGFLLLLRMVFSFRSLAYSLREWWRWLDDRCQAHQLYRIPRYAEGEGGQENPLFRKALAYLNSLPSLEDSDCVTVFSTGRRPNDFFLQLDPGRPLADSFLGSRLSWTLADAGTSPCLLLRLRRHDRRRVLRPYLHHVEAVADDADLRRRECRLFSVRPGGAGWSGPVPLSHPSTLDTVAVEPELRGRVKSDLESFLKGKAYYARLGRVWKRSYLLHGPPGTGKSSFAAAMAKFLNYDVYDLDLSAAGGEADLRSLLLRTTPRSLILVEDLDRHLSASGSRDAGAAAAAMLGFMDGVFSCCGDERVMVFTMRGPKEGLDPAFLRPGRLDVHVHFPLCGFPAFKALASSHLGLKDHKLYPQVEEGFQTGARLSPAEVGEIMIANRGSPSRALKTVINALQHSSSGSRLVYSGSLRKTVSESASSAKAATASEESSVGGIGFGKEATVREFKKLYGLIRMRGSGSRKEGTMSVHMAAAAAATANAAAAANVANYLDRSSDRDLGYY